MNLSWSSHLPSLPPSLLFSPPPLHLTPRIQAPANKKGKIENVQGASPAISLLIPLCMVVLQMLHHSAKWAVKGLAHACPLPCFNLRGMSINARAMTTSCSKAPNPPTDLLNRSCVSLLRMRGFTKLRLWGLFAAFSWEIWQTT